MSLHVQKICPFLSRNCLLALSHLWKRKPSCQLLPWLPGLPQSSKHEKCGGWDGRNFCVSAGRVEKAFTIYLLHRMPLGITSAWDVASFQCWGRGSSGRPGSLPHLIINGLEEGTMMGPGWAPRVQALYTIPCPLFIALFSFPISVWVSKVFLGPQDNVLGILCFDSLSYSFQIPNKVFFSTPSY